MSAQALVTRLADLAARAPRTRPRPHSGAACGRVGCLCTHTDPCDRGWLDTPPTVTNGQTYDVVVPCPICRPEAASAYEKYLLANSRNTR